MADSDNLAIRTLRYLPWQAKALKDVLSGQHRGVSWAGGKGCLRGDTPIHDPVDDTTLTVRERWQRGVPFHVWALGPDGPVIAAAMPPVLYPETDMLRVTTDSGESIVVTPGHRFLTAHGEWVKAGAIPLPPGSSPFLLASSSGGAPVISVTPENPEEYFDFHVPGYENYWACGMWHHNSGKSLLVCASAVMICLTRPGAQVVLAMDCHRSLRDIHQPLLARLLRGLPDVEFVGDEWHFRSSGAVIRLRHLDYAGDPTLGGSPLEGPNLDAILIDESQKVDARYFLTALERTRVSTNGLPPVVVFSGLPVNTWWCRMALEQGWPVYRPRTADNARNLSAGYEQTLRDNYTEAQARALLDGEELVLEGAIFKEYRQTAYPDGNIAPADWAPDYANSRTVLAADLGIRHPAVLLAVEDVRLGAWVVTKEWMPDQITITELCQLLLKDTVPRNPNISHGPPGTRIPVDQIIIDPAGAARSGQTGNADADVWAMLPPIGYGLRPTWERDQTRRGVVDGITRVCLNLERRSLLFTGDLIARGMAVAAKKRSLAKSLVGYRWDDKNKARPMKDGFFDHAADALNYLNRHVMWNGWGANHGFKRIDPNQQLMAARVLAGWDDGDFTAPGRDAK